MINEYDESEYKMVIVYLKNGEKIAGPAMIHRPVGKSTDIEDWIYTDFVLMHKPLKIVSDLSTERLVFGVFQYLFMTDSNHAMIKTDGIESISYLNEDAINLYNVSSRYFDEIVNPRIKKEMTAYANKLENNLQSSSDKFTSKGDDFVSKIKEMYTHFLAGSANNTIH